jgi:KDO2-lipid IV(A) lauroyltransferase
MIPPHLHPKTWPTWIGLGIFRLLILLPYPLVMRSGGWIGHITWWLLPAKRRLVLKKNLELCFPELETSERENLARQHIESMGKGTLEVALAWWGKSEKLSKLVNFIGLEHLEKASTAGHGVILLSAHFSSLEIGGRLLALKAPFEALYRPSDNPAVEYLMQKNRSRHTEGAISKNDIKGMIRSLRKGKTIWYAPDQSPGLKNSVSAPFFGIDTLTSTATARLAKLTGASVIPFIPLRRSDGTGYDLQLFAALDNFPSDDEVADAVRINQLFESWIRERPEEYFWFHRRFKRQSTGKSGFYS